MNAKQLLKIASTTRTLFFIMIFFLGLYVYSTYTQRELIEPFQNPLHENKCPNLLIKKNNLLYLYRKEDPEIPGVNPIVFENLEDYVEHVKYQRSQGIRCPVLYLQHMYSSEGKPVYRIYPSPEDTNTGLPYLQSNIQVERNLIDAGFTEGNMPGYDYVGLDNGVNTPLDKMFYSPESISDNAMDPHWGGVVYSREIVDSGKYEDNTRKEVDSQVYKHESVIPTNIGLKNPLPTMNSGGSKFVPPTNEIQSKKTLYVQS